MALAGLAFFDQGSGCVVQVRSLLLGIFGQDLMLRGSKGDDDLGELFTGLG
jgi:hypothetical protein